MSFILFMVLSDKAREDFSTNYEKIRGERISCLIPLLGLNIVDGDPFIRMEKDTLLTHNIIVLTILIGKPIVRRMLSRKSHSTL